MTSRMTVTYHVTTSPDAIERRAKGIAVEQSVEMPLPAIDDPRILSDIVGEVQDITDLGGGTYRVQIGLAVETTGLEPGQFLNMIYGNTSIHDDTVLVDVAPTPELFAAFGGPNKGVAGLRAGLVPVGSDPDETARRAMTCSALKPQGLSPERLADLAYRFALGGPDFIKDDHGLADQTYAPYDRRVPAIAAAVRRAGQETGRPVRYLPSLSGTLDRMRDQIRLGRSEGLEVFMIAPMIAGFPTVQALVTENPDLAFFSHPTMTGAQRIAPACLHGQLFRLMGADAVIYTNYGGRFGFSRETCRRMAAHALRPWGGIKPALPVPAGGMTLDRVGEMIACYGPDVILLIGGDLLLARETLAEETRRFVEAVAAQAADPQALADVAE